MFANRNVFHPWLGQIQQFQNEMNRLLDRWNEDGPRSLGWSAFPPINVWEDGDTLHVEAELPGMKLADLEIFVTSNNQLTIKGERKSAAPENSVRHRQERGVGKFLRTLTLPFAVDANTVEARLEHGILLIQLHKHEAAKARKITVKGE